LRDGTTMLRDVGALERGGERERTSHALAHAALAAQRPHAIRALRRSVRRARRA
jgi:hypothetical protein